MGYVSVRDMRLKASDVWDRLRSEGELILTSNGRPVAVMAAVDEAGAEDALLAFRRARAQAALSRMRQAAAASGASNLSEDEIQAEIDAVRAARRG